MDHTRPKFGIALGGGGVLGLAHVGVLRVLEQERIEVDAVAGTSVGAVIGACFAAGMTADELTDMALDMSWRKIRKRVLPRLALFSNVRLGTYLEQKLPIQAFDQLPRALAAIATDLLTGEMVVLHGGALGPPREGQTPIVGVRTDSVIDAARASCAIPIIFEPVEVDGRLLIDGGLTSNVPAGVARMLGADVVVAVDVAKRGPRKSRPSNIIEYMDQVTDIYLSWMIRNRAIFADVVVQPGLAGFSADTFHRVADIISAGEQAARDSLEQIQAGIDAAGRAMQGRV